VEFQLYRTVAAAAAVEKRDVDIAVRSRHERVCIQTKHFLEAVHLYEATRIYALSLIKLGHRRHGRQPWGNRGMRHTRVMCPPQLSGVYTTEKGLQYII